MPKRYENLMYENQVTSRSNKEVKNNNQTIITKEYIVNNFTCNYTKFLAK